MYLDVVELRRFYYRTPLGRVAQRAIRDAIAEMWPDVSGEVLAGFGFSAPYLRPMMESAARTICLMPAQQGVMFWPAEGPNISTLVEESYWPLTAGFVDRMIVAHGIESSERPDLLLEEVHRVLAPGGKVIFVVPNRSGLWARTDQTPFGHGRPFTVGQFESMLGRHGFVPERHSAALYSVPSNKKFWLKTGALAERTGRKLDWQRLAGAVLVEATREVYAKPKGGVRVKRSALDVLEGLAPVRKPAPSGPTTGRKINS